MKNRQESNTKEQVTALHEIVNEKVDKMQGMIAESDEQKQSLSKQLELKNAQLHENDDYANVWIERLAGIISAQPLYGSIETESSQPD
jgi:hypothetical protein